MIRSRRSLVLRLATIGAAALGVMPALVQAQDYPALVQLFREWRTFERPIIHDGIPDYGAAAIAAKAAALPDWRRRLAAIDSQAWPATQRTDHRLIEAEMNGLDFDLRVLRPWARDPSFYVSIWPSRTDVPSREAPVSSPEIQLYQFKYPLTPASQRDLTSRIGMIPAFLDQARINLQNSDARDLWIYGVQSLRGQARTLAQLEAGTLRVSTLEGSRRADMTGASPALRRAIAAARLATEGFIAWLQTEAPAKSGPSGVGKENYSWYQRNVHFVPYSWDDEVALLRRELERAHAALRLEEHNNRRLPPLEPAANAEAYDRLARAHLDKFVDFLVHNDIIPDKPYLKDALRPQLGRFVPPERREFFAHVGMREPMVMLSHDYHWIDLARTRDEPNADPIRREASLSNIWDNRAEGFATAVEELLMHAGLYDDNPRARELVWIMLANRAARGLASLYVQANKMTLDEAARFQGEWTPRGWSDAHGQLTGFEQLLYLRQPGYGSSYITGKLLFDRLLTDYAHQQDLSGKPFTLRDLLARWNDSGMIPAPLVEADLLGDKAATAGR